MFETGLEDGHKIIVSLKGQYQQKSGHLATGEPHLTFHIIKINRAKKLNKITLVGIFDFSRLSLYGNKSPDLAPPQPLLANIGKASPCRTERRQRQKRGN
jgi:hypothetical protein